MADIASAAKFLKVSIDSLLARASERKVSVFADTRLSFALMVETLGFKEAIGAPKKREYKGFMYFLQWILTTAILGVGGFAIGYFLFHPLPDWIRPSGKGALYWSIVGNLFWGLFLATWGCVSFVKSYSKENLRGVTKGLISDPHIESFQRGEHLVFRVCVSVLYQVCGQGYYGDYTGFGVTKEASYKGIPPQIEQTLLKLTDGTEVVVHFNTPEPLRFSLENPARERRIALGLGSAATLASSGFFISAGALFRLL